MAHAWVGSTWVEPTRPTSNGQYQPPVEATTHKSDIVAERRGGTPIQSPATSTCSRACLVPGDNTCLLVLAEKLNVLRHVAAATATSPESCEVAEEDAFLESQGADLLGTNGCSIVEPPRCPRVGRFNVVGRREHQGGVVDWLLVWRECACSVPRMAEDDGIEVLSDHGTARNSNPAPLLSRPIASTASIRPSSPSSPTVVRSPHPSIRRAPVPRIIPRLSRSFLGPPSPPVSVSIRSTTSRRPDAAPCGGASLTASAALPPASSPVQHPAGPLPQTEWQHHKSCRRPVCIGVPRPDGVCELSYQREAALGDLPFTGFHRSTQAAVAKWLKHKVWHSHGYYSEIEEIC
ncbi:hypothetical protein EJB05_16343, partial [Eragrostis curvula]